MIGGGGRELGESKPRGRGDQGNLDQGGGRSRGRGRNLGWMMAPSSKCVVWLEQTKMTVRLHVRTDTVSMEGSVKGEIRWPHSLMDPLF